MEKQRVIVELGSGNDLHGGDYTKASVRALEDALRHSSLTMLRSLQKKPEDMEIRIIVGVQKPTLVNPIEIKNQIPYGSVEVEVVHGGLDIPDPELNDIVVIASVAIEVRLEISLD